jgi:plastocyanin
VAAAPRVDLRSAARHAVALAAVLLSATAAHAGQVRVDVGPSTDFSTRVVNVNLGDQVVWVWTGAAMHTVSSGDSSLGNQAGVFESDPAQLGQGSLTRFAWKSSQLGTILYYCAIHAPTMASRIIVSDPNSVPAVPVSDFRITEVQYNLGTGQDLIEITNYGAAVGNLGRYRIATASSGTGTELPVTNVLVPSMGRVVIHLNATGTNTNTDVFITSFSPGTGLPNTSGALALYVPNTVSPSNALSRQDMIVDFVQWGAGAQANEATAAGAGFWNAGTFLPTVNAGHSIEYCADANLTHGVNRWAEVSSPNFGSNGNCATPTVESTWGRVKTVYRR